MPGSVPLTVFPLLNNAGNLTSTTNQTYLRQGQVGELANQYMVNKNNGSVNFYPNPNVQGANVLRNGGESPSTMRCSSKSPSRTRHGLQGQFSYTFGKTLSNTAGDGQTGLEPLLDNNNPQLEWARSPYDLRHVFKANYYYELPFGKGKSWSGNAILNGVLGNWALSGIWSYQAGSPVLRALRLRHLEPGGTLHRHQHGLGERHHAGPTGALDGRRVHDRQRPVLRLAVAHRRRRTRRLASRLAPLLGTVVLQSGAGYGGQPAAPHVHRSLAVAVGYGDQEIVQVQGASLTWTWALT